jgi:hypothetical protein
LPAIPLESGNGIPAAVLAPMAPDMRSSAPAEMPAGKPVPAQTTATAITESDFRPAEVATTPQVQGIRIPLAPEGLDRVEIQVQERQGEIEVSVRSPDMKTRSILREGLSELVTSLDQHGLTLSGEAETSKASEASQFAGESSMESVEQVKDMSREESLDSDARRQSQRDNTQDESNGQPRRRRSWQEWMNHMEDMQWWTR